MSRSKEIVTLPYRVDGGLNEHDDPEFIEDNQLAICKNFNVYRGRLEKRYPFTTAGVPGSAAGKKVRILGYFQNAADSQLIISVEDGSGTVDGVWWTDTNGAVWTQIGAFTGNFCRGVQYGGLFYLVNTAGNIRTWDGVSSFGPIAILAGYYFGDQLQDRFFFWAQGSGSVDIIRYTDPGAPSILPAINSISVNYLEPGDIITNLLGYKDRIVVFKENRIHVLYLTGTPVNWSFKPFVEGIGCTGSDAAVKAEDWIYFIDRKGVYRTNLSSIEELSGPIKNAFKYRASIVNDFPTPNQRMGGLGDAIGYYRNMIVCSINVLDPNAGAYSRKHRMFVYHLDTQVWTEWLPKHNSNIGDNYQAPLSMFTVEEAAYDAANVTRVQPGLWMGTSELQGELVHYSNENFGYQDPDGEYDCVLKTKDFTLDSPYDLKKIPYKFIDCTVDNELELDVQDYVEGVAQGSPLTFTPGTFNKSIRMPGPGYARKYSMQATFHVPSGTDDDGVIVRGLGLGARIPRPIQTEQLT